MDVSDEGERQTMQVPAFIRQYPIRLLHAHHSMNLDRFSINAMLPALLLAALLAGFGARLFQLDRHTFTHPEMYVPGIAIPDYVSNPSRRMTLSEVMLGSLIFDDPHPPGHHVMMLLWNRAFGTGLFTLRLTSVLAGTLTLWVLFVYARQLAGNTIAILTTWMLALHGYHIYWSQHAKAWVVIALLVVLSSWLLLRLERKPGLPGVAVYTLVTAAGLWVEYFFWPVFLLQILWVMHRNARREHVPLALEAQLLAFTLATPVLIYIYMHASGRTSHLSGDLWQYTLWVLQFCGLLQLDGLARQFPLLAKWLSPLLAFAGALALGAGLYATSRKSVAAAENGGGRTRGVAMMLILCAVLTTVMVVRVFSESYGNRLIYKTVLVLPWCIVTVWMLRNWLWRGIRGVLGRGIDLPVIGRLLLDPLVVLGLGPVLLVFLLSVKMPLLSPYVLVTFMPLLLLLMARGICRFGRYGIIFVALLLPVSVLSVQQNVTNKHTGRNYQGFAQQLRERLQPGDVLLVRDAWMMTPLHYYFPPQQYHLLPPPQAGGGGTRVSGLPDRLWIVESGPPGRRESNVALTSRQLQGFVPVEEITVPPFVAVLQERKSR